MLPTYALPFWRSYYRRIKAYLPTCQSDPAHYLTQLMQWDLSFIDEQTYRRRT